MTRYWTAWMLSLSLLIMTLAPSISVELAHFTGSDQFLLEICSATKSTKSVLLEKIKRASQTQDEEAPHRAHCPLCVTHGHDLNFLPMHWVVTPILKTLITFPALFYQSAHLVFIWAAPQSRAPPYFLNG